MFNPSKIDLKNEISELKKINGEERGGDVKYLKRYVKMKFGDAGVEKLKQELERNGYRLPDIEEIKEMDWVPASLVTIYMVGASKVFNLGEKELYDMGNNLMKFPHPLRYFLRYFVSPKKTLVMAANKWRSNYTFGKLEVESYDADKREIIVNLKDFRKHKVTCLYLAGGFASIVEMTTGSKNVKIEETKCVFEGDPYHQYKISW